MTMNRTSGMDSTLYDPPPLRPPPLSLLDLAIPLIDVDDLNANARMAAEDAAKASENGDDDRVAQMDAWHSDTMKRLAELERWEDGFTYLPELSNTEAMEIFVEGSGASKGSGVVQTDMAWYDPFVAVGRDARSTFGLPANSYEARAQRAMRALRAHEAWQVEREFWTGANVPTNYHLAADPDTPLTSPHRTIDAWADLTPAAGTTLGIAVGLKRAMAALNQSIADFDAGTGMIHATPYMVELWASNAPGRFLQGQLFTINGNIIVPGYGYPGTGPDSARTFADAETASNTALTSATANFTGDDVGATVAGAGIVAGTTISSVTNSTTVVLSQATIASASGVTVTITLPRNTGGRYQWAYATDMVYKCSGPAQTLPYEVDEQAPGINVNNLAEVRVERHWAMITNHLCRAAVLVDTQTA